MGRVRLVAAIVAVAAMAALAGCTPTAQSATAGSVPAALQKFYDQKLTWKSCEKGGITCTTVTTPIDWSKPSDGTIKLAVIRHVSTSSKRMGSLLMNPGGPGGSGYDFIAQDLDYVTDATLRAGYDIVSWDPRGVGKSSPIACLDGPAMDQYLYSAPTAPEGSAAWLEAQVPIAQNYAAACKKNTGELLGHIDAESNARDMDLIRAVLHSPKLDYLGFSYGTFFGAHYAKLFPKNVGRMVLDGPVDPALGESQDFTDQMGGFESAYKAYLADCLKGSGCPFTGTVDDALAQTTALISTVDAEKLTNSDGRVLDESTLGVAIGYPLYSQDAWPALSQMLVAVQNGDPSIAFRFADGYNGRNDDGSYTEEKNVYIAALCLDGVYPTDLAGTQATVDSIAKAAPTIGTIFAYSDWVQVSIACQNWPYKSVLHAEEIHAKGAAPIMVVGTTNDPATPYTGAVSLAKQLDSGFLVSRTGEGHTAYGSGNACVDSTVDAFLTKGTKPASDPHC